MILSSKSFAQPFNLSTRVQPKNCVSPSMFCLLMYTITITRQFHLSLMQFVLFARFHKLQGSLYYQAKQCNIRRRNPSKWQYICIVWSPQNGFHLITPELSSCYYVDICRYMYIYILYFWTFTHLWKKGLIIKAKYREIKAGRWFPGG